MPLFALSGTIVSAGFLVLLHLFAFNYVWSCLHKPLPSQAVVNAITLQGEVVSAPSETELAYVWVDAAPRSLERSAAIYSSNSFVSWGEALRFLLLPQSFAQLERRSSVNDRFCVDLPRDAYRKSLSRRGPPMV